MPRSDDMIDHLSNVNACQRQTIDTLQQRINLLNGRINHLECCLEQDVRRIEELKKMLAHYTEGK